MSTLWTPDGERPVRREPAGPAGGPPEGGPDVSGAAGSWEDAGVAGGGPGDEELAQQLAEVQAEVLAAPAADIVANHVYGLFQLASIHLSQPAPRLEEAAVAIDAMGFVVEGLGDRLGEAAPVLADGLAQLRMAFVQIKAAADAAGGPVQG